MNSRTYLLALALALVAVPAYADKPPANPCGNHGNNCNPGNPPGNPNPTGTNPPITITHTNTNTNTNTNTATATGGAGGQGGQGGQGGLGGNGYGGNATGGSATGGNASATGGSSTSSSNSGGNTLSVNEAAQPDDITIRQAPSVFVGAAPATVSCYKTAAGGVSGVIGGLSISGGGIDANCEHRELVRVAASIDPAAAKRLLCLSELYQLANRAQCGGIPLVYLLNNRTRASIVQPK